MNTVPGGWSGVSMVSWSGVSCVFVVIIFSCVSGVFYVSSVSCFTIVIIFSTFAAHMRYFGV